VTEVAGLSKKYFIIVTILFVIISLSTVGLEDDRWWHYANQVLLVLYIMAMQGPVVAENIRKRKPGWRVDFIFRVLISLVLLGLDTYQFVSGTKTKFMWVLAMAVVLSVGFVIDFVMHLKSKREKGKIQ
jgi:hypothetical protein